MSQSETLFRLIALMQSIPRSPSFKSTTTLVSFMEEEGFKVSMRMVQRDLEKLSRYFPIECDSTQKPYRWSFREGYKSNLPALDAISALSWVLAEEHLQPLLPAIAFDKLQPQFEQARDFLDGQKQNLFQHWRHQIKAVPNGKTLIPAEIPECIWRGVTEGLLMGKVLNTVYLSREKNECKIYRLHPLGLVVRHSSTYLLAMVNDYDDVRQFALHRFQSVEILEQSSRQQPIFCLEDYVESGAFGYPIDEQNITLKALVDADTAWHLKETPVSEHQTLDKTDNPHQMRLTAMVPNDQQTQWWLMGFGSKIEVLEPLSWRQAILQHAQEIVQKTSVESNLQKP